MLESNCQVKYDSGIQPLEKAKNEEMEEIIKIFLDTPFDALERRVRRINRLDEREDYA